MSIRDVKNALLLPFLLLFLGISGCQQQPPEAIPDNAVLLRETTVVTVNGVQIGSGNYYERETASGEKKMGMQLSLFSEEDPSKESFVAYIGDVITVGSKQYTVLNIVPGEQEVGRAVLIPVETGDTRDP